MNKLDQLIEYIETSDLSDKQIKFIVDNLINIREAYCKKFGEDIDI